MTTITFLLNWELQGNRLSLVLALTTILHPIPLLNFQGTVQNSLFWKDTKIKITHILLVLQWTLCYWTSEKNYVYRNTKLVKLSYGFLLNERDYNILFSLKSIFIPLGNGLILRAQFLCIQRDYWGILPILTLMIPIGLIMNSKPLKLAYPFYEWISLFRSIALRS